MLRAAGVERASFRAGRTEMSWTQIRKDVLLAAIAELGDTFTTKDVSEHPRMLDAHPVLSKDARYDALVRACLAQLSQIESAGRRSARGEVWRRPGVVPSLHVPPPESTVTLSKADLGPQCPGDNAFTARMRFHQSWYRAKVLRLPYGTGPKKNSTTSFGNMLRPEDGDKGKNFLTPQIFEVARRRLKGGGGTVEPFGLLHNMLSSQPMCFNLFGPLVDDLDLATRLARALWGNAIGRVTRVAIEWAPEPMQEYLNDRTAFDAFIEYDCQGGGLGFAGVETKLTDPFSDRRYDGPLYRRWMGDGSPWREDAYERVADGVHNQLWRDHLLVWSMLRQPRSDYREGRLVVVRHPTDEASGRTIAGYAELLRDDSTLQELLLSELVDAWTPVVGPGSWLDDFELRYLRLERSGAVRGEEQPTRATTPATAPALREGHYRALEQVEDPVAYDTTRQLYAERIGGHGVYLRPTDSGFTVVSLDFERCGTIVAVGAEGTQQHSLRRLPPDARRVARACEGYEAKLAASTRVSAVDRFSLAIVARALAEDLSLPRAGTYFVCQGWRFPEGGTVDLVGVEPASGRLLVVVLKGSRAESRKEDQDKGGDARAQATLYADRLYRDRRELYPFFERLARAMAQHHGGPRSLRNLRLDPGRKPRCAVWWPEGSREPPSTGP